MVPAIIERGIAFVITCCPDNHRVRSNAVSCVRRGENGHLPWSGASPITDFERTPIIRSKSGGKSFMLYRGGK
jgi:hypothetical protein